MHLAAWGVVGVGAVGAFLLWWLGDRWGPATIMLFGPRWLTVPPLILLATAIAIWNRSAWVPLGIASLIVLFPILGFRTGWRAWVSTGQREGDVRVITFNAAGARSLEPEAYSFLTAPDVDLVAVQECGELRNVFTRLRGWYADQRGSACLLSRFPILDVKQMEREGLLTAGGSGLVVTYTLDAAQRPIHLTNLHLETPRRGFEAILDGKVSEGLRQLSTSSQLRMIESDLARRWIEGTPEAAIVAGDFNTPVESSIYRTHWGDMRNAFSYAGVGFGRTRDNGWIKVRIDHVLTKGSWRPIRAFVGPDLGSDHRALVADLRWTGK